MAKHKRPRPAELKFGGGRRNSRATVSGPSEPSTYTSSSDLDVKLAGTEELASSMPFNANKPLEYDAGAATAPRAGQAIVPQDPLVTASTVTEANGWDKVGSGGPTIGTKGTGTSSVTTFRSFSFRTR
jgi:catalase